MQKKLTNTELKKLQKQYQLIVDLKSQLANAALEKEVAIRTINAEFDKKFNLLNPQIENEINFQSKMVVELNEIYGNSQYNLDTGVITQNDQQKK